MRRPFPAACHAAGAHYTVSAPARRSPETPSIKDEDRALFRAAVRDVSPLKQPKRPPERERRKARAASRRADEARVLADSLAFDADALDVESGDELGFRREGISESVLRKLKRGEYAIRDELDLHGMTQDEARAALAAFLSASALHGRRCLRVIHGKGRGSGHRGPVLKSAVNRWLRRHGSVAAFCSARRNDGGTGAIYVLLSR
ncbi:MAG TPA: Smr/MutS family protein [Steroidobacteraceae bacterium]|nr:Smr/MutS family protein [Steroidobacteraceae bacterium]